VSSIPPFLRGMAILAAVALVIVALVLVVATRGRLGYDGERSAAAQPAYSAP